MFGLSRLRLGLSSGFAGPAHTITKSASPSLGAMQDGDTVASAFTPGVYASANGPITGQPATATINGVPGQAMSTTVSGGDVVTVQEVPTDGTDSRTFTAGPVTVSFVSSGAFSSAFSSAFST